MTGCILAALTYFPIFHGLTQFGNPDVFAAQEKNPVTVVADPNACAFQFDPVGKAKFVSSCDMAKSLLAKRAIPYENIKAESGAVAQVHIGDKIIASFEGAGMPAADFKVQSEVFTAQLAASLKEAGYPEKADPAKINHLMMLVLLTVLVIYVTMVYGPIAAWLVELFPTRIRYTSMSLPYHIGNGWFGGFLPTVAFAMVAATGDIYYGLWYPIVIAVMTAILGIFFLPETKDRDITN